MTRGQTNRHKLKNFPEEVKGEKWGKAVGGLAFGKIANMSKRHFCNNQRKDNESQSPEIALYAGKFSWWGLFQIMSHALFFPPNAVAQSPPKEVGADFWAKKFNQKKGVTWGKH